MKTATKWIIGIVIGLVVLALLAAGMYVAFNWWGGSAWMMEARTGRLWGESRVMPHWNMPGHQMPMHSLWGSPMNRVWFNFFPFRAIANILLCLALPALIALGVVSLVLSQRRSRPSNVAAASTPAAAAPEATPVSVEEKGEPVSRACSNCDRPVNQDWSHCPYCGNALS